MDTDHRGALTLNLLETASKWIFWLFQKSLFVVFRFRLTCFELASEIPANIKPILMSY